MRTTDFVHRLPIRARAAGAGLLALAILAGCSPASSQCTGTSAQCSGTSLTFCDKGVERTISCKGPLGCDAGACDTSTHTVGEGCVSGSQCDAVVTTRLLSCVTGQLRAFRTCSGPRQCYSENGQTGCDVTIGDSCPAAYEARYFCDSFDTQQVVRCTDGGVVLYSTCAGAKNCATGDGGLICQ